MISAAAWIARGKAARNPTKYNVEDEAELERVAKLTNVHFDDAKEQLAKAQKAAANWNREGQQQDEAGDGWEDDDNDDDDEDIKDDEKTAEAAAGAGQEVVADDATMDTDDANDLAKYNLDSYDNDAEEESAGQLGAFSNIKGLQFYRNNDEDPYITMKEEDEDEDREELEVLPTDNLIVCAKTEDEVSLLEAYVYSSEDSNLYVHHDLMLPSFPLCLEWLDYKPAGHGADQNSAPGTKGNFIAVGTMDPEIEIWSMDVVEGLFPDALLGRRDLTEALNGPKGTGKKKKKLPKARVANPNYHVDAVLSLSWNRTVPNLLCSASADKTIKLWDLSRPSETTSTSGGVGALRSFDSIHTDKVQSVAWDDSGKARGSINRPATLLSGSYDKTLAVFDTRSPDSSVRAGVASDVECVKWNPWREHNFFVSMEDGLVQSFDARVLSSSSKAPTPSSTPTLFTLSAHDGGCTSLDISPHIPGCLATAGTDKLVKLWSIDEDYSGTSSNEPGAKPKGISMVTSRDLDAGKIFSASFSPDEPLSLAVAGSRGVLRVWDTLANVGVRKTFGERLSQVRGGAPAIDGKEPSRGDGVVRVADDDDDDDDDEGPDGEVGDERMQE